MQYWRHQGHSRNVSFPLEGKCRGAAKGCTTLQDGLTRYGYVTAKRRLLPANRNLLPFVSKAARTEILRFAQNDDRAAGRNPEEPEYAARNFMSHIRSLRDLGFSAKSLLSSGA